MFKQSFSHSVSSVNFLFSEFHTEIMEISYLNSRSKTRMVKIGFAHFKPPPLPPPPPQHEVVFLSFCHTPKLHAFSGNPIKICSNRAKKNLLLLVQNQLMFF
jgi:hypothetical protein